MGYRTAANHQRSAEQGTLVAKQQELAWRELGPIRTHLDQLSARNQTLEAMIPEWQEELMAHGSVRKAAADVGLELERIKFEEPVRVGDEIEGQVIVERLVALEGSGQDLCGLQLVDALRELGWPVALHSLDLIRSTEPGSSTRHVLKIGLFHYATAADFSGTSEMETETTTSIEAPAQ
jgi:Tfp pilus assembly protein PilO